MLPSQDGLSRLESVEGHPAEGRGGRHVRVGNVDAQTPGWGKIQLSCGHHLFTSHCKLKSEVTQPFIYLRPEMKPILTDLIKSVPVVLVADLNVSLMTGMCAFWTERSLVTVGIALRRAAKSSRKSNRAPEEVAG